MIEPIDLCEQHCRKLMTQGSKILEAIFSLEVCKKLKKWAKILFVLKTFKMF
jgi:hypothetical protein